MKDIDERIAYWNQTRPEDRRTLGEDISIFKLALEVRELRNESNRRFLHQKEVINENAKRLTETDSALAFACLALVAHLLWHAAAAVVRWRRR
jgi:hypothetical protein